MPKILIALLALFALFFLSSPVSSSAQTEGTLSNSQLLKIVQQLQEQIKSLQEQITKLQNELGATSSTQTPSVSSTETGETEIIKEEETEEPEEIEIPELTKTLFLGNRGEEVRSLQTYLAKDKKMYPEGLITGYFGPLTQAAVKRWQEKHDIAAVGIVGPKTREKLTEIKAGTGKRGKETISRLIEEGAGASDVVPPGLLKAPGIQKEIETIVTPTVTPPATVTPLTSTTTSIIAATSTQPVAHQTTATAAGAVSPKTSAFLPVTTIVSQLPQKPWDVVVSDSDYIVTTVDLDKNTGRLLRITQDGKISTIAALSKRLSGVAVSGSDYYILDGNTNLLKISPDGTVATIISLVNAGIGTGTNSQNDIAVSGSDFIVTDFVGGRLLRITPIGNVSIITGDLRHPKADSSY